MAQFNIVITNKGRQLFTDSAAGKAVSFTRMELGDGLYTGNLQGVEQLVSPKIPLQLSKVTRIENRAEIRAQLTMNQVKEPFYFREIGVFAKSTDGTETLVIYGNAGDKPDYITASDSIFDERDMILNIFLAQNEIITELNSVLYVSKKELEHHQNDKNLHHTVLSYSKSGSTHQLTGLSAASGLISAVFKTAADFMAGDALTIDGAPYTARLSNGEAPEDKLFTAGASVSAVVDTSANIINFKSGGGLSNAKLALANATIKDVTWGKKFYAGDSTLKTGTLIPYKYATGKFLIPKGHADTNGSYIIQALRLPFAPMIFIMTLYDRNEYNDPYPCILFARFNNKQENETAVDEIMFDNKTMYSFIKTKTDLHGSTLWTKFAGSESDHGFSKWSATEKSTYYIIGK